MASASTRKQCANDDGCKQGAVTNCEGCSKAFCIKHFNDHRRLLDEEMNVIIDEHDHLKNTLNQQTTKPDSHPLIKEIDHWEKESITQIQKRANELRQELLRSTTTHTDDVAKKLQQLSEQLKRGREQDDYIETDLQLWKKALDNLKTNLTSPSTISINRRNNVSLVQNITIDLLTKTKEEFERVSDNRIRIEKNGQVATHDRSQYATEVRGKNEYRSERHEIRLCIEQLDGDWIFLGVNSKLTPVHNLSHGLQSAYG
jgi:chaperonin cofactor prefoldin